MSGNSKATVKLQKVERREEEEEGEAEEEEKTVRVTRELQINGGGEMGMEKELILKRIRQRKRIHRFRATLQSLVASPFSKSKAAPPHDSSLPDPFTFF